MKNSGLVKMVHNTGTMPLSMITLVMVNQQEEPMDQIKSALRLHRQNAV